MGAAAVAVPVPAPALPFVPIAAPHGGALGLVEALALAGRLGGGDDGGEEEEGAKQQEEEGEMSHGLRVQVGLGSTMLAPRVKTPDSRREEIGV